MLFGGPAGKHSGAGPAVTGAVSALVRTLAVELAPVRVNAIHPGHVAGAPAGRPVTMAEVADAMVFLLRNKGVNAVDLHVDGGL